MIIRLLFVLFIVFITKIFIARFDFNDYFNITVSFLFILFNYIFIIYGSKRVVLLILLIALFLIIYSYNKLDSSNSSIVIINGKINFRNMIKNKYSILQLLKDLKNNKIILNNKVCGIIVNNKIELYYKEYINRPISLIINGSICYKELELIGKDENWLNKKISNIDINSIIYSFYIGKVLYIIKK